MLKGSHHTKQAKEKNKLAHTGKRPSPKTEFKKGMTSWLKGTKGLKKPNKTSFKPSGVTFKGTVGQYIYLHKKIYKLFGQPSICEKCGKAELSGRQIHWANISGNYLLERSDWLRLCVKCHWTMDRSL
jgi:hypothetical protein